MTWQRIVIVKKDFASDMELVDNAVFAGAGDIENIIRGQVYLIRGVNKDKIEEIAPSLFFNPVSESIYYNTLPDWNYDIIEVEYLPGVMDPVALTVTEIISEFIQEDVEVTTRKIFFIKGEYDRKILLKRVLLNSLIEHEVKVGSSPVKKKLFSSKEIEKIDLLDKRAEELKNISDKMMLSLNEDEMLAIQEYFSKLEREPTDTELETIAQTWSEHCVHKTLKGIFEFEGETIDNLLKKTIVSATEKINRKDCLSVFKDNAGIVRINEDLAYCVKVETHNHPSALEPYGGAGTGLGGVIRDILGTGLGAKPVAGIDVFCTGNPESNYTDITEGVLHPRRILKGIVAGVRDYGNRVGVPTLSGALIVDDRYTYNPLVFAGCIGLLPVKDVEKEALSGDKIVLIGGRTGRDGLHGATFSSMSLDAESEKISAGAVQIGNPIEEKKTIDAMMRIRDENLLHDVTDCGAGGLSSAVGEMASETGALVYLEKVPLKYTSIAPWEIWLSESQERMVLAVCEKNIKRVAEICQEEQTDMSIIGEFTDSGKLQVFFSDEIVADLDMTFLHDGIPRKKINAKRRKRAQANNITLVEEDISSHFFKVLSWFDIASKEWIIRQYDHQVQGRTILTPFDGVKQTTHSDGARIRTEYDSEIQLSVGLGINHNFGEIDCYKMALFIIEEALRNLVCSGGDPQKAVLLDNFSWGDTEDQYEMGDLVLTSKGCHDASVNYNTPFISGKDSLNNTYIVNGRSVSIPPTLLITAVSLSDKKSPGVNFKKPGDRVWLIGPVTEDLSGSYMLKLNGIISNSLPDIDLSLSREILVSIYDNLDKFTSLHDVSDGGLITAVAEMIIGSDYGICIEVSEGLNTLGFLFSESPSRFVVASDEDIDMKEVLSGLPVVEIGVVDNSRRLKIKYKGGIYKYSIEEIENAFFSRKL